MFGRKTATQALVVGAGPVGLFAALQLARHGVDVAIIDSQWRTAARSYALALHPSTLRQFDDVGLAEPLLAQGRRVDRVDYCDREGIQATLDFGRLSGKFSFVLVMPQHLLETALENRLAELGVDVMWSHRLVGLEPDVDGVKATIQRLAKESTGYSVSSTEWVVEKTLASQTGFVVGADGHASAVRRLAGIGFEETGASQRFAVFECTSESEAKNRIQIVLEELSSGVYWPLPGNRFRWSFELTGEESVPERAKRRLAVQVGEASYPYLTAENFAQLLAERAPWCDAEAGEIQWSVAVRFEHRLATEFGRGRISLLGDAAHLAGPIGVKSMNVGLEEATELAERVAGVVKSAESTAAIGAFERERTSRWRQIASGGTRPAPGEPPADWILQRADRLPACVPASGRDLEELLEQVNLELR